MTRVAVMPCPPLVVPELTVRARPETQRLRDTCVGVAAELRKASGTWLVVAADAHGPQRIGPDVAGTFAGFGADVTVGLRDTIRGSVDAGLPLPVLVAAWLRTAVGAEEATVEMLAADTAPQEAHAEGRRLVLEQSNRPVGLLVMADGPRWSGRHPTDPASPAAIVDAQVRHALRDGDTAGLLGLDPALCHRAGLEGRAALGALAGAIDASGGSWDADLRYSAAPFGVGYHVALWSRTT